MAGTKGQWKCEADRGTPTPVVEWQKMATDGTTIVQSYGKGTSSSILTLDNISADDQSEYRCLAENIGGQVSESFFLYSGGKLIIYKFGHKIIGSFISNSA